MSIKSINNYNFSNSRISFAKKNEKNTHSKSNKANNSAEVPSYRMVPAMLALAGLTTLNSCSEDFKYADMRTLNKECLRDFEVDNQNLNKVKEKTITINTEKDSLYKETDDYSYRHLRIKSHDHTRVFGEIIRKNDNTALEFVNVYDENDKLTSTTLKDPKTNETFYVTYKKGFFDKVKDKDGNELPSSKYGDLLAIILLAAGLYGAGKVAANAAAPKMTNKDVPFIEPPEHKED